MTRAQTTPEARAKNANKVVAEILAGRFDGYLKDLGDALGERLRQGPRFMWRLRLDGDEWTEESVTAAELAWVENRLSIRTIINGETVVRPFSYMQLNPMAQIDHALHLIVAHLVKVGGMAPTDALARVEKITQKEWADILDVYEVADAPKDDPETSTIS